MYLTKSLNKVLCVALIGCGLVFSPVHAGNFDEWKKQQNSGYTQVKDEFAEYKAELNAAFDEYKRKTAAVWGKDNAEPDSKRWITYVDKLNQRSVVDFEEGTVVVEVAVPVEQVVDDEQGKKELEQALVKAIRQGEDKRPIQEVAEHPVSKPTGEDVLTGQLSLPDGTAAKAEDYPALAQNAAANATKKTITGDDGQKRVVYQTQLRLVPNHIRLRASKYQNLVNKYSAEFDISPAVVFAVMETESMFNPTARSGAPAFGLMQLVPTSGARDAYRHVFKTDKVVSDTYLYDPENNVRLGAAYINRLYTGYLSGIESDESRLLATIAAYNTGAGNVFRTFAGKYNKRKHGSYRKYKTAALYEINRLTPGQFYQRMRLNLPYEETRHYIKKVTDRMTKYEAG